MVCSYCRTDNLGGANFCKNCGNSILGSIKSKKERALSLLEFYDFLKDNDRLRCLSNAFNDLLSPGDVASVVTRIGNKKGGYSIKDVLLKLNTGPHVVVSPRIKAWQAKGGGYDKLGSPDIEFEPENIVKLNIEHKYSIYFEYQIKLANSAFEPYFEIMDCALSGQMFIEIDIPMYIE